MQNLYTNLSGVESLWITHTVANPTLTTFAAPRFYQTTVTGGTVAATTTQAFTHNPDTTIHRYMPSLAVDRGGNMLMGYSASSSTLFPSLRWAGRLAGDAVSTLPQTETTLLRVQDRRIRVTVGAITPRCRSTRMAVLFGLQANIT